MNNSFFRQAEDGNKTALIKKEIIRTYITGGDFSITDLSKEMGLSVPTITKLVGELMKEGFVHDFGKIQDTSGGRRPNIYGLNSDAGYFMGVDIKKDLVEIGVINFKGQMVEHSEHGPFVLENSMQSLDDLCRIIESAIEKMDVPRQKILSIGVNLSGRVNANTGYSYSYYFFDEKPLNELMAEKLDCIVHIDNDSRAMAYGEYMCGAARGESNVLFINVSWGMGTGMILDGKLFYGKSGFSGEYGHFPFYENEIICRCGKRGCLETEVSGIAVHRQFLEKLEEGRVSMLSEQFKQRQEITLNDIINAVIREDVLAIEIFESVGHQLGRAVSGLINTFNPDLIIIGGTLARTKDYLMLPVKSAINKYSLSLVSKDTTIVLSKLGEIAGVTGACMLARSKTLGMM